MVWLRYKGDIVTPRCKRFVLESKAHSWQEYYDYMHSEPKFNCEHEYWEVHRVCWNADLTGDLDTGERACVCWNVDLPHGMVTEK